MSSQCTFIVAERCWAGLGLKRYPHECLITQATRDNSDRLEPFKAVQDGHIPRTLLRHPRGISNPHTCRTPKLSINRFETTAYLSLGFVKLLSQQRWLGRARVNYSCDKVGRVPLLPLGEGLMGPSAPEGAVLTKKMGCARMNSWSLGSSRS